MDSICWRPSDIGRRQGAKKQNSLPPSRIELEIFAFQSLVRFTSATRYHCAIEALGLTPILILYPEITVKLYEEIFDHAPVWERVEQKYQGLVSVTCSLLSLGYPGTYS